jgi:hypothetical protein
MPITIQKISKGYTATVTPPHGKSRYWKTDHPMSVDELIEGLRKLGCHQTDIGDAFYEADPNWLQEVD